MGQSALHFPRYSGCAIISFITNRCPSHTSSFTITVSADPPLIFHLKSWKRSNKTTVRGFPEAIFRSLLASILSCHQGIKHKWVSKSTKRPVTCALVQSQSCWQAIHASSCTLCLRRRPSFTSCFLAFIFASYYSSSFQLGLVSLCLWKWFLVASVVPPYVSHWKAYQTWCFTLTPLHLYAMPFKKGKAPQKPVTESAYHGHSHYCHCFSIFFHIHKSGRISSYNLHELASPRAG